MLLYSAKFLQERWYSYLLPIPFFPYSMSKLFFFLSSEPAIRHLMLAASLPYTRGM